MKRMSIKRISSIALFISGLIAATTAFAQVQGNNGMGYGGMMNGWMGGGYNGILLLVLLVVVVAGLVAWIVAQKQK